MKNHPTITDLDPKGCRWPVGQDHEGRHRFCNERQTVSGPYCPQHRAKAYGGIPAYKPMKDKRGKR